MNFQVVYKYCQESTEIEPTDDSDGDFQVVESALFTATAHVWDLCDEFFSKCTPHDPSNNGGGGSANAAEKIVLK